MWPFIQSVPFSALLLLSRVAHFHCEVLPHPGCEISRLSKEYRAQFSLGEMPGLWCDELGLDIPTNFNVTLLPAYVESVILRGENRSNILRDNAQPIPFRAKLTEIEMSNFRGSSEGQRPPIERFLQNNKRQLVVLAIINVPLRYLEKSFLVGYHALASLSFIRCSLESLEAEIFAPLALPKPVLGTLHLDFNALNRLDWSVFQPLAKSLRKLELQEQSGGITSLHRSGADYQFSKLWIMSLSRNRLRTIPNEILRSIPKLPDYETSMGFDNEEFCGKSDCSCCHLKDFMEWAVSMPRIGPNTTANIRFTCGNHLYTFGKFPSLEIYKNCSESNEVTINEDTNQSPNDTELAIVPYG